MKTNLAPFIDLFSILAIGLLVIMSVTSGTDKPSRVRPSYTVIMLYLGKPASIEKRFPGIAMDELLKIDPYFIMDGKEVPISSLNVTADVAREPGNITVLIIGDTDGLSIGFRVVEVVNPYTIFEEFDVAVLATGNSAQKGGKDGVVEKLRVGNWVDPVVSI